MSVRSGSTFTDSMKVALIYAGVVTVCGISDIGETESVYVFTGTAVHLSLNVSYITTAMDIIRWRYKKLDSEVNSLIVEYHLGGSYPPVELENLKGRSKFSVTDYSLTINEVQYDDAGIYAVEARDGNDGRIMRIKSTVMFVTDAPTLQSVFAPAGTTVLLSLRANYFPKEMCTIKWQHCKQGSEGCGLIVEYNFSGKQPLIQLHALKGRADFSRTKYSLLIEKVDFQDAGSYIVDVRLSPVENFKTIDNLSLIITGLWIPGLLRNFSSWTKNEELISFFGLDQV